MRLHAAWIREATALASAGEVANRQPAWSSPLFPYFGWIILGWSLTWAAVELGMLQRLLHTESLTGGYWLIVLGLSLVTPALVGIDKAVQQRRQNKVRQAAA